MPGLDSQKESQKGQKGSGMRIIINVDGCGYRVLIADQKRVTHLVREPIGTKLRLWMWPPYGYRRQLSHEIIKQLDFRIFHRRKKIERPILSLLICNNFRVTS